MEKGGEVLERVRDIEMEKERERERNGGDTNERRQQRP